MGAILHVFELLLEIHVGGYVKGWILNPISEEMYILWKEKGEVSPF